MRALTTSGLSAAAVALARACLEQAFRETIQLPYTERFELDDLIKAADRTKTLDGGHLQMAKIVQRNGNQVLHGENCTDAQALDTLVSVRGVVERLYVPAPED